MAPFDQRIAALETRLGLAKRRLKCLRALARMNRFEKLAQAQARTIALAERTAELVRRSLELAKRHQRQTRGD